MSPYLLLSKPQACFASLRLCRNVLTWLNFAFYLILIKPRTLKKCQGIIYLYVFICLSVCLVLKQSAPLVKLFKNFIFQCSSYLILESKLEREEIGKSKKHFLFTVLYRTCRSAYQSIPHSKTTLAYSHFSIPSSPP